MQGQELSKYKHVTFHSRLLLTHICKDFKCLFSGQSTLRVSPSTLFDLFLLKTHHIFSPFMCVSAQEGREVRKRFLYHIGYVYTVYKSVFACFRLG